jgi:hypothetical protein
LGRCGVIVEDREVYDTLYSMSRGGTLILLGLLLATIPFSGLPISFRTLLSVLLSLGVCSIGVFVRSQDVVKKESTQVTQQAIG